MCGNGIKAVDDFRVAVFQPFRLVEVVVGGVEREDVHEETYDARTLTLFDERGGAVGDLREVKGIIVPVVWSDQLVFSPVFALAYLEQTVVVGPRHDDVDVVVPWDDAVMAHGTYCRACTAIECQVVTFADVNERFEYVEYRGVPSLLYVFYVHYICLFIAHDNSCTHIPRQS